MYCKYGCGAIGKFKTKGGQLICAASPNSCPMNKQKNSIRLQKSYNAGNHKRDYTKLPDSSKEKMKWNKGKTKHTDERIKILGENLSKKYANGDLIPHFKGKSHSSEAKAKMSANATGWISGGRTKWHEIYCPLVSRTIKVQGKLELKYAQYLNENSILWNKSKSFSFKYRIPSESFDRTYFPDFYLPETNEYVEIKGYWANPKGRPADKDKMKYVLERNPEINFKVLLNREVEELVRAVGFEPTL